LFSAETLFVLGVFFLLADVATGVGQVVDEEIQFFHGLNGKGLLQNL
jgi:hypothetical protein